MKLTGALLVLSACLLAASVEAGRSKRSLENFQDQIGCVLPGVPLGGLDYGCYCGSGSSGKPVDALDKCCMVHDKCLAETLKTSCPSGLTKGRVDAYGQVSYKFKCDQRTPTCENWCRSSLCGCQQAQCECDRKGALCFAGAVRSFSHKYVEYPKEHCQ